MSQENTEQEKECFSCKVITVSTLVSIGTYLAAQGKRIRSLPYLFLGGGTICLGIGEVFGKSPFR